MVIVLNIEKRTKLNLKMFLYFFNRQTLLRFFFGFFLKILCNCVEGGNDKYIHMRIDKNVFVTRRLDEVNNRNLWVGEGWQIDTTMWVKVSLKMGVITQKVGCI